MLWDDVERILRRRADYVLVGDGRQFPFSLAMVPGRQRMKLAAIITRIADARTIDVEVVSDFPRGSYVQKGTKTGV